MKKIIASLVLAAFAAAPFPASGRESPVSRQSADGQAVRASVRLAYREITLYLRDGTVVSGRLLGADAESVRVLRGGPDLDVPFRDIKKAVIGVEGKTSKGVLPGVTMGLFLGTGLISGAFSRPGNYMQHWSFDSDYAAIGILYLGLIESAFAATGGALGSLVASGTRHRAFEFPGNPEESRESRDRFLRFIGGEPVPARFHLLIQGGHVYRRVSRKFDAAIEEAGFSSQYSYVDASRFSILRGFELSYSLKPRLRTGIRMSFPSETARLAHIVDEFGYWTNLTQEFRATAFHAVCSFELLRRKPSDALSWSAGLGIGAAAVRLRRDFWSYGDGALLEGEVEAKKTLPSGVAFTALQLRLNEVLTAGLAADFTLISAATIPGLSGLGLAAKKAGLGNASVGFVLGYHF